MSMMYWDDVIVPFLGSLLCSDHGVKAVDGVSAVPAAGLDLKSGQDPLLYLSLFKPLIA